MTDTESNNKKFTEVDKLYEIFQIFIKTLEKDYPKEEGNKIQIGANVSGELQGLKILNVHFAVDLDIVEENKIFGRVSLRKPKTDMKSIPMFYYDSMGNYGINDNYLSSNFEDFSKQFNSIITSAFLKLVLKEI